MGVADPEHVGPSDYSMIALLAGTVTAPSAKLPPYKPPLTPEEQAILKSKERKAISALINGFLSVVGVGVAGWWAGGSIGMRQDHVSSASIRFMRTILNMCLLLAEGTSFRIWCDCRCDHGSRSLLDLAVEI